MPPITVIAKYCPELLAAMHAFLCDSCIACGIIAYHMFSSDMHFKYPNNIINYFFSVTKFLSLPRLYSVKMAFHILFNGL